MISIFLYKYSALRYKFTCSKILHLMAFHFISFHKQTWRFLIIPYICSKNWKDQTNVTLRSHTKRTTCWYPFSPFWYNTPGEKPKICFFIEVPHLFWNNSSNIRWIDRFHGWKHIICSCSIFRLKSSSNPLVVFKIKRSKVLHALSNNFYMFSSQNVTFPVFFMSYVEDLLLIDSKLTKNLAVLNIQITAQVHFLKKRSKNWKKINSKLTKLLEKTDSIKLRNQNRLLKDAPQTIKKCTKFSSEFSEIFMIPIKKTHKPVILEIHSITSCLLPDEVIQKIRLQFPLLFIELELLDSYEC